MAHKAAPFLRSGPAPHWRSPLRRVHLNIALLVGLLPVLAGALWAFGWPALTRLALAGGAAVVVELLTQIAFRQKVRISDLSALLQGLLLALFLPPTVPIWLLVIGVVVMIVVGKQIFGGVGGYPLHPVLIAWAVLLLSWGNQVLPTSEIGVLGTGWFVAPWIGGTILLVTGHLKWEAPLGMLGGVTFAAFGLGYLYPEVFAPADQLLAGTVALAAFFVASDSTCCPPNAWARLLFGLIAGMLVVILRLWGTWAEPIPFAILLASILGPVLDRVSRAKPKRRLVSHA